MTDHLSGMTGFARAEGEFGSLRWVWEGRSVNGKGLEARFRWPAGYERLEGAVRDAAKHRFARGNLQCSLTLRQDGETPAVSVDVNAVKVLLASAAPLLASGDVTAPRLDGLMSVPGVLVSSERDALEIDPELDAALVASLAELLDRLKQARLEEGVALSGILSGQVDDIERLTTEASCLAVTRTEALKLRLEQKFNELLPKGLDEDRLATEAAALAVKLDVQEELDRLKAHIQSARQLIQQGSPVGRKLDFLTQEFNREANTLCSKSQDPALTTVGLALKNVIDQMREQVQNVE
ncbi:YicC/YloC family endoribonuclease [Maricaulis sp. D1M11]|uniref:YicC/YloC family endoribonuclease n=1 Tax=Maricaulis sp. D1M11 TaxID=3076117 RepID=UPI0039B4F900